jgi:hypothetical protein
MKVSGQLHAPVALPHGRLKMRKKLSLFITNQALSHEDVWGERMYRITYSWHRHFNTGTHWIGGWVGPRTGLNDVKKKKTCLSRESKCEPSAAQPVANRYTDCVKFDAITVGTTKNKIFWHMMQCSLVDRNKLSSLKKEALGTSNMLVHI